jgi:NAD(P)H-hydrate epimerase
MVLDADGINVIDCIPEILKEKKGDMIITPHPGELGRLIDRSTGDIQDDRMGAARETAVAYGMWVVLKGARTIISTPDGDIYIAAGGNPGMATGGTGDVLTGLIGGFLAQGADPLTAALAGVWVHNDAGDRAAQKTGEVSLLAGDLLEAVCETTRELSGKRYDEVTPYVRRIA